MRRSVTPYLRGAALLGWSFGALACAQLDTGHVANESLLAALDCPEEVTEVEQIGAYRYRGEGCGRVATVACTAQSFEPRCVPERVSERAPERTAGGAAPRPSEDPAAGDTAAGDTAAGDTAEPAAPRVEEPDVEDAIRRGLDARRADILACVGAERVAVRAGYAPDGSVALSLRGALEGSPEEGCVQDALDGVRVPARGRSGVVIHLVGPGAEAPPDTR